MEWKRCIVALTSADVSACFEPLKAGFVGRSVGMELVPSSAEESAIFRRFSLGEESEEVLRRRLGAGELRWRE